MQFTDIIDIQNSVFYLLDHLRFQCSVNQFLNTLSTQVEPDFTDHQRDNNCSDGIEQRISDIGSADTDEYHDRRYRITAVMPGICVQ